MFVIVAYDIADDKRRIKVMKLLRLGTAARLWRTRAGKRL